MVDQVELMMKLIKSEVTGAAPCIALPISLSLEESKALYELSKYHDLAHIVGSALSKVRVELLAEAKTMFQKQMLTAVFRYETIKYEYDRICNALETAKISFVPLKGLVVRKYYPEPWMRTSCDIDILVHEEDLDRAVEALVSNIGYACDGKRNYHDVSLYSGSGVHLELHFSIKETMDSIDGLLDKVWEYCEVCDGKIYEHRQSEEYLMFHLIAHMSYHFTHGGCGVKSLVDIYLLERGLRYDKDKLTEICESCGINRFRESVLELIGVWFENRPHTELTQAMERYIVKGGAYGTAEQSMALEQSKMGGKGKYLLSRIFMPYESLKIKYPRLENRRWLTPIYQLRRWFSALFGGRTGRSVRELRTVKRMDGEESEAIVELMKKVGLE